MNRTGPVKRIVICGGGTAGWMAAALFTRMLGPSGPQVTIVESSELGTVGVGEATIPPIVQFNAMLGIDEAQFVRETEATFKLGIEFVDWQRPGTRYMHPFGPFGADMNETSFTHFWLRAVANGLAPDLLPFNAEMQAAYQGKFAPRAGNRPDGAKIHYAYQFDASRYAAFLRGIAEGMGATRADAKISRVLLDPEDGFITAVELADGRQIEGDLFIDCTGFRALLIGETLGSRFEEWSKWLPVNRAAAMPTVRVGDPEPLTRVTARDAGWQWHIPLQHRTGNGYVFCEAFLSEDDASRAIARNVAGAALDEPRVLRFTTGRREQSWVKNCVAVGLSSGFLEPLESTGIHLIQTALHMLLSFFPDRSCATPVRDRFNAEMERQSSGIRDFIVAHYKLSERRDTEFWRHCAAMPMPDSLEEKIALFTARGEVFARPGDLFKEANWFAILFGQGVRPLGWHPLADAMPLPDLKTNLAAIAQIVASRVADMPRHAEYLR